jgi:serine/threonine protein phosphatase PrpC
MGLNILALKILVYSGHEIAGSPQEALMAAFTETDIVFRLELEMQRSQKKGTSGAQWHPGCTATTALLIGNKLFVANAGDCRTVLCRNGKAIPLSKVMDYLSSVIVIQTQ